LRHSLPASPQSRVLYGGEPLNWQIRSPAMA